VIEIDGLGFKYVGRREPTIRDLSLSIQAGESVLVLGPSGCGKSTLALCLNGAVPQAISGEMSGAVRIDGLDTRRASMADLAQRVGIVFQDPEAQFCMLNVEDEVAFGLENLAVPRAEMDARIDGALAMVGLLDRRGERIERLSGGQKQRLALACVLAQEPDILVLDEPTAQLDPAATAEVMALLGRLRAQRRHTLVIVEHRLDEVMPLVDRALVFSASGELVADGPPRQVIREHGDWLAEAGVWTPHVSELARGLAHKGIVVDPFPVTVDEAVTALRPHVPRLEEAPLHPTMGRCAARTSATPTSLHPHGHLTPSPPYHGPLRGGGAGGEGHRCSPLQRNGDDVGAGPERCRSAERYSRSAGACEPKDSRAAQRPGVWSSTPLLQVRGLSFGYARAPKPVLRGLSFSIESGELVAVVGANGAGKSTLARLIAGIVRPPAGAVLVNGRDVSAVRTGALARDVGYVFQYPEHQFVGQTVLDDVAYGLRRAGVAEKEAVARANAMLDDFGLSRLGPAHPFTLSHGEQRRLSVASMLVLGQRLLLLDEPTFGQDQRNATMLLDKLEALAASGRAIVAVSHDMRLVAERAQRVLVLVDGSLVFDGPPADLFADADLLARARLTPPPLWELSARLGLLRPLTVPVAASRQDNRTGPLVAGPVGRGSPA
jgi:energy-coupling factor transport system ATP-binding protein